MRLKFTFAVATAVVLAGCAHTRKTTAGEPGLQETQGWMNSFVADRGVGSTYAGGGCSGAVTWLKNDSPYYTFSFSLGDLDSNTVTSVHAVVSPPALQNVWRVTAVTTNKLQKVAFDNHQTEQPTHDSGIEGINFRSNEDADRFAKALRHAIVLCGGKPSAF